MRGVVEGINALILGAAFLSGGTAFLKGAVKAIGEDKIVTTGGNIVSAATVRNDTISQFGDRKVVDERRDSLSGGVNTTLGVLIGAGIAKKKKTPEQIDTNLSDNQFNRSDEALERKNTTTETGASTRPQVILDQSRNPASVRHADDATDVGHPTTLTIDRSRTSSNRRESLRGMETRPNLDRDEWPPAMFREGGNGASTRHIPSSDNRSSGSCIGHQCRGLPDGTEVDIRIRRPDGNVIPPGSRYDNNRNNGDKDGG